MTTHIKILVDFERQTEKHSWQVKVDKNITVAMLMIKLRKFAKLKPCESVFLFFRSNNLLYGKDKLYPGNKTVLEIQKELCQEILSVKMMVENCFGAFSKMFIKAKIQERKSLYVSTITYSYYGLYHFDEVKVHDTLTDATEHLLRERCSGYLTLESNEKKE